MNTNTNSNVTNDPQVIEARRAREAAEAAEREAIAGADERVNAGKRQRLDALRELSMRPALDAKCAAIRARITANAVELALLEEELKAAHEQHHLVYVREAQRLGEQLGDAQRVGEVRWNEVVADTQRAVGKALAEAGKKRGKSMLSAEPHTLVEPRFI